MLPDDYEQRMQRHADQMSLLVTAIGAGRSAEFFREQADRAKQRLDDAYNEFHERTNDSGAAESEPVADDP